MKKGIVAFAAMLAIGLPACSTDAAVVSENLSKAADQFEISRRVVFFNGITDSYLLEIIGLCSIEDEGHQLEVTCQVEPGQYRKHFLGLSDNVSYFVEQLNPANVSAHHYRVVFKPQEIIPDIDLVTSGSDLPRVQP
jgi:hypothetical protein